MIARLEDPDLVRARQNALRIAFKNYIDGLIPLNRYILFKHLHSAHLVPGVVTLVALFLLSFAIGYFTGFNPKKSEA